MSVVLLDTTVVSLLHPKKQRSEILAGYTVHMEKQTLALAFRAWRSSGIGPKPGSGVTRPGMDSIASSSVSSSFLTISHSHRRGHAQCSPAGRKVAGLIRETAG